MLNFKFNINICGLYLDLLSDVNIMAKQLRFRVEYPSSNTGEGQKNFRFVTLPCLVILLTIADDLLTCSKF